MGLGSGCWKLAGLGGKGGRRPPVPGRKLVVWNGLVWLVVGAGR